MTTPVNTATDHDTDNCPVVVVGAGAWGTALACAFSRNTSTVLWSRDPAQLEQMVQTRINARYLPQTRLPDALMLEADLHRALAHVTERPNQPASRAGLVILGTPMAGLPAITEKILADLQATGGRILGLIWTCKGLDAQSAKLPHEIMQTELEAADKTVPIGALSGPSFAKEVAQGLPVALTIASENEALCEATIQTLHSPHVRVYQSTDVLGVSVGGALKNIMAIACGISDGLELGDNARAALLTRGLAEMRRFGVALGAQASTFAGLTGLGDLVLTATGDLSRNRQLGLAIGQGQSPQVLLNQGITAEGARCVGAVLERARTLGVNLPISEAVHAVLFEGLSAQDCVTQLMTRDPARDI
ncbi:NAD(P)H-dependent glycerol-3-phosphate dehydrogenase [Orrella sp. 11846]|uniref:NAD(P)H-dependent glycerol-3-phosphate dehydrogenase n=1 Tax=Orrella sp. 11846 TaxID=3409913 RepID=UPI003B5CC61D